MSSDIDHDKAIQEQFEKDAIEQSKMERIADQEKADKKDQNPDKYFVRSLLDSKQINESDAERREREGTVDSQIQLNSRPSVNISTDVPYTLDQIKNLQIRELDGKVFKVKEEDVPEFLKLKMQSEKQNPRYDSIYMEGMKYGTQSGLYYRATQINEFIDRNKSKFSRIANFTPLLLANGKVVPPIITESKNNTNNESPYTLRSVDRSYQIQEQAKVINTPLTWMEYLLITPPKAILPNESLLPLNDKEHEYWDAGVTRGWLYGLTQANSIYKENIRKMERDYIGMVRFHLMLSRGLITNPISSSVNLGVTGNDKDMNVNEVIFNIDRLPQFNKDAETWKALPEVDDIL